ncbi:MAG: hypothetical protein H0V68_04510 [Actinobacteria bacterium]|nr:hypothetical protein [Actinomycetota bacterium]
MKTRLFAPVRLVLVTLLLAVGGAAARPECAYACSCGPVDATRDLPRSDAALVGELLFKADEQTGQGEATYVFSVERVVKGTLGSRVEIRSGADGASCGFEVGEGQRIGLLLDRDGDVWRSGLCSQLPPAELLASAKAAGFEDYSPLDEEQSPPRVNWGGIVVGLLVLGLGGFLLVRRLRRR